MNEFLLIYMAALSLLLAMSNGRGAVTAPTNEHGTFLSGDQCDWTGSGGGGRGVRPVYLRCSRGTVSWRYPRGALRVVLSTAGAAVTGTTTIRTLPVITTASATITSSTTGTATASNTLVSSANPGSESVLPGLRGCVKVSGPVRVYLESNGTLRPVYSPTDGKHEESHRCFHARKQPAALYIEADDISYKYRGNLAKLQYDLESNVKRERSAARRLYEEDAECRPCTMEELAKAYCQSDLVARGTVSAVQKKPDLEAAELVLTITKTLHSVEEAVGNEIGVDDFNAPREVRVRVPTICDARHGQGEFVVMAKKRLGDLTLVCAPRLESWAEAVRALENAPCVLTS